MSRSMIHPLDRMVFQELIQSAHRLGATEAGIISTSDISVEDDLARLCHEPRCKHYGLSANCPPHVSGPSGFRKLLKNFEQALVFKIEVPSEILLSDEHDEIFRLLHEIAAAIEREAVRMGYFNSRAYAGGSCKQLFCQDHPHCRVLKEGGKCWHPDRARPSMSGFGINVSKLIRAAGWSMNRVIPEAKSITSPMGTICGLVLIG